MEFLRSIKFWFAFWLVSLFVGLLPLPAAARFGIDLILMGGIVLAGMRPLLPFVRNALAGRSA